MKELQKNWNEFDRFLKDQLLIGLFIQCNWALVSPIIMKLQGMLWTTTFISVYLILMRMGGIVAPYFKGTPLKKTYSFMIFLNVLYVLATPLFFYDQSLFLLAESFLSIFFCVNSIILGIAWDVYVVDKYEKTMFENFRYASSFRDGIGGIGGNLIVIGIYAILDQFQSMKLFVFLMVFVLLLQVYNYRTHYIHMEE